MPAQPTAEYGAKLARSCIGCHGEHFSGGAIPGAPSDLPIPANLTPHKSGVAAISEADWNRILDTGIKRSGVPLNSFMPIEALRAMNAAARGALGHNPSCYDERVEKTFYRRPLPSEAIAFSSPEGRALFADALAKGGLDGYFQLAEQFHTQSDPAFCGLGSLVVALNALAIDPGRLWKGPWRWFAEDLLDCCVPLPQVRERGLTLDELACLARCNGAEVDARHSTPEPRDLDAFRSALEACARGERVMIASYDRSALGQTGSGHFSPVGGYHAERDLVLLLDVARFKYPPHWIRADALWRAMHALDPAADRSRGWLTLHARAHGVALGFTLRCTDGSWQALAERIEAAYRQLAEAVDLRALVRALRPIASAVELRTPSTPAHERALSGARAALTALPLYARVRAALTDEPSLSEVATLLLLASAQLLSPTQRAELGELSLLEPLTDELHNLTAQIAAVLGAQP